jgi:hypothetical protein
MKPQTKREQTLVNTGARKALSIVIAHARRLNKRYETSPPDTAYFDLVQWLLDADQRYQKKLNGIGRRATRNRED